MEKEKLEKLLEVCPVLTSDEKELIRLRDVEGKMNKEVAAMFGTLAHGRAGSQAQ